MQLPANVTASHEASIEISSSPEEVFDLISDVTRMGEWSPEATGGTWADGATGAVGDWFQGHNETPDRQWDRDCQVASTERGRDFTFVVGGIEDNCTWWSYEMSPTESGTLLTERWWVVNLTPALQAASDEQVAGRFAMTEGMLHSTLAAIKVTAESA